MTDDIVAGHAAPVVPDGLFRPHLLEKLTKLAPYLSYVVVEGPSQPTVVKVLSDGQESWSWVLPAFTGARWVLTVEEFLALELERLGGLLGGAGG